MQEWKGILHEKKNHIDLISNRIQVINKVYKIEIALLNITKKVHI